ncbi:hypothetical protein SAMN05192580_0745 [Sphingomonas jatrophae]|uniref:Uncharacterized protein n=2 Tax=Sphingomonas jatrophae TaxID=1166337 RepID=A0A1I6JRW3_9SPHN|nr:hypothetical protein SAMN05192580_0745 [Sphingomonas jatrophae]
MPFASPEDPSPAKRNARNRHARDIWDMIVVCALVSIVIAIVLYFAGAFRLSTG